MSNFDIARRLQQHARELRKRHDNLFRVRAYGLAAETLMRLDKPVEEMVHQRGRAALEELPGIGKHIARSIEHFVETGEWQLPN
jgi:DNA polymerase/3'-5' exonuclease PolX